MIVPVVAGSAVMASFENMTFNRRRTLKTNQKGEEYEQRGRAKGRCRWWWWMMNYSIYMLVDTVLEYFRSVKSNLGETTAVWL